MRSATIRNELEVSEARALVENNLKLFMFYAAKLYKVNQFDLYQELICLFMEKYNTWDMKYSLSTFLNLLVLRANEAMRKFSKWSKAHKTNRNREELNDSELYDPWSRFELDKVKFTKLLNRGFKALTPRQRGMIRDRFYKDMEYKDIGEKYGCTRQAAWDAIACGLSKLRPFLEEFADDCCE